MPGTLQAITVGKQPQRIQTWLAPNDAVLLVNNDITNQMFVGNDPGTQNIPIPALGSLALADTRKDVWISTGGANVSLQALLLPSGTQWTPSPAQVAAQINALGLATSANQGTQITAANTGNASLATTVTNTANTASNVSTVNTTLGSPSQSQDVKNLTTGGNPGGIPVLRGTDNLGSGSAQSLTANATATLIASANITKPGFEAIFKLNLPASAGTVPFATINVLWQDSNTGLQVGQKSYVITAGNGPTNALTFYLSGPCRGNQIVLTITNNDPAQIMTLTWAFNQTAHTYIVDRLLQAGYSAANPIGYSNPGGAPTKGLLFSANPSIGPNTNITRLCAASNARVLINVDDSGQANGWALEILGPVSSAGPVSSPLLYGEGSTSVTMLKLNGAAGTFSQTQFQMPSGPVLLNMHNTAANNTISLGVSILIEDY